MKKKNIINAVITSGESINYNYYFELYMDESNYILDGGRDFISYNNELLKDIKKQLNEYSSYNLEYSGCYTLKEFLNCYLPKENKKSWSGKEISTFKKVAQAFDNCRSWDENETIIPVLNIITKKNYKVYSLHGYCQGDCVELLAPLNEIDDQVINDLEALFFGGGYEVFCVDEKVKNAEDVLYNDNYVSFFTSVYKKEDLQKLILQNYYYNKEDVEIKIYEQKPKNVVIYNYEEM